MVEGFETDLLFIQFFDFDTEIWVRALEVYKEVICSLWCHAGVWLFAIESPKLMDLCYFFIFESLYVSQAGMVVSWEF